jgi:glutathione peroxidase
MTKNIYEFIVKKIDGSEVSLGAFQGKVMLVVNVASKCGLTPQYEGLQKIYKQYHDQGLVVLGFPANEFLSQEPGSNTEIQQFCTMNFGVDFPMFEKIVVKGEGQHPLYSYLTETRPDARMKEGGNLLARLKEKGLLGGKANDIKWNFEKFLVNRHGEIVERFSPDVDPMDSMIVNAVEREIARP